MSKEDGSSDISVAILSAICLCTSPILILEKTEQNDILFKTDTAMWRFFESRAPWQRLAIGRQEALARRRHFLGKRKVRNDVSPAK